MAIELAPAAPTTEKALRKRIHRLFSADGPRELHRSPSPHFWVEPTEVQKNTLVLDIHEPIALRDEADVHAEERRWLNEPHVDLDGMSPQAMLTGDEGSRQRLGTFIAAIEAAIGHGSFS